MKDNVYKLYRFLGDAALHKHSVHMYHASQTEEARSFLQNLSDRHEMPLCNCSIQNGIYMIMHNRT